jgi:hypothetical protein
VGIGLLVVPVVRGGDGDAAAGFSSYIQSGTCAQPEDEFVVDVDGDDSSYDVEPYRALGGDGEPITLGYYGDAGVPGFGLGAIYGGDQQYSLVVEDPETDEAVACGDILRPEADEFGEAGLALVQLLPVGSSGAEEAVQGMAVIERTRLQRELDITPTRVRTLLTTGPVSAPGRADGFGGYVQGGRCDSPVGELRAELENRDDDDEPAVTPYRGISPGTEEPVTLGYYGAAGAPGFGLAAAYTDQEFSLVIEDGSGGPVGCGDILEPEAEQYEEAGLALVQVQPAGEGGVEGFAVLDRVGMQRELDVTPTVVKVLLFAPPATTE